MKGSRMSVQRTSPVTETAPGSLTNRSTDVPIIAVDLPVIYEDEGQEEVGESEIHSITLAILYMGLKAHLGGRAEYRIFSDLDMYYHRVDHWAYKTGKRYVRPAEAQAELDAQAERIRSLEAELSRLRRQPPEG